MAKNRETKERNVFSKICSILIDIFIVPVVIVAFGCAILMTTAKANNQVPSIMGNSIVEVLTSSMDVGTPESYKVGDVLIIDKTVNVDDLKVGDCIAFYAPKQSKFTTDGTVNGDSLIIFHRIVRIVEAKEIKNGVVSEEVKRHFVCRGDACGPMTAQNGALIPALGEESDYDENGNVQPGGGYIVKLKDDDVASDGHSAQMDQSEFQYVTDEFVVGKLKSRASGFLSALVKFCCSQIGILVLVIVPSTIMIALVVTSIAQESKLLKKEKESDQMILAQNISMMSGGASGEVKQENVSETPEKPAEQKDVKAEESKVEEQTKKAEPEEKTAKKAPAKPVPAKKAPEKVLEKAPEKAEPVTLPAKEPIKPVVANTLEKAEPAKKAPATPKAPTAKKAPTAPEKAETKKAPSAPKAPATPKTPAAPKAPSAPKPAPAKKEPTAPKTAPAKTPSAPKAPAKPATEKKAPPKKG